MHPSIRALLDLHEVNLKRQKLLDNRDKRDATLNQARKELAEFERRAEEAQAEVDNSDALIRQYTGDLERCEKTVQSLREQQMDAKTNKDYLGILNGIEEAKTEMKLRKESLDSLGAQVEEKKAAAEQAQARLAKAHEQFDALQARLDGGGEAAESLAELEKLYETKRPEVDAKFLETYERLIQSRHKMPLIPIDPRTRATPLGNVISHNQIEQIHGGMLVIDSFSNGILYIRE